VPTRISRSLPQPSSIRANSPARNKPRQPQPQHMKVAASLSNGRSVGSFAEQWQLRCPVSRDLVHPHLADLRRTTSPETPVQRLVSPNLVRQGRSLGAVSFNLVRGGRSLGGVSFDQARDSHLSAVSMGEAHSSAPAHLSPMDQQPGSPHLVHPTQW
jgi:hypothetical protein